MPVAAAAPIAALSLAGVRAHRGRFASLVFAIFVGVLFIAATLVITDTVKAGFSSLFGDAYQNVSVVVQEKSTAQRQGEVFRGRIDSELTNAIAKVPGVDAVSERIAGYAYVVNQAGAAPPGVASETSGAPIAENWIADAKMNPYTLVRGRAPNRPGDVVIDRGTANALSIKINDRVRVVAKDGTTDARVVGVVRFGAVDSPGAVPVVLFTSSDAQRLLGETGRIDAVFASRDPKVAHDDAELASRISKAIPSTVEAVTGEAAAKERENQVANSLRFITAFLLIFAVLSLVVGAFIIANTFAISISQRSQELALLRAIGGSRSQIFRMVIGEAAVMSVVGSVAGLLGGIGLASLMRSILRATGVDIPPSPLVVRPTTVAWSLGIGILVTLGAAVSPAIKAGRISPVAALRDSEIEPPPLMRRTIVGLIVLVLGGLVIRRGATMPSLPQTGLGVGLLLGGSLLVAPAVSTIARLLVAPVESIFGPTNGLAIRNATRNPRRTASTALALSLGSAVACFALILNASLQTSLAGAVGGGLKGDLVVRSGSFGVGGLPISLADELLAIPNVEAVTGVRYGFASVTGPKRPARKASAVRRTGARPIASLDPRFADRLVDFGNEKGNFATLGEQTIALSRRELDDHGWNVGDRITLAFPGKPPATFTISAVYRQGLAFDFAIGHSDYERLVADQFDFVEYVGVKPQADVLEVKAAIESAVAKYPTARVDDPKTYTARITSSLDQLLSLIFGLLVLVVVIAVIGIAITLSLSVVERLREIGMLRTLGMFRSQLRAMLRAEAIVISLIAVVIGVALGTLSSWGLLHALRDEGLTAFTVPPVGITMLALLAAFSGLLASIVPARRAARLPMLQALAGIRNITAQVRRQRSEAQRGEAERFSRGHVRRVAATSAGFAVLAGLGVGYLVGRSTSSPAARASASSPASAPAVSSLASAPAVSSLAAAPASTASTSSATSSAPSAPSAPAAAGAAGAAGAVNDGVRFLNDSYPLPLDSGVAQRGRLRSATPIDAPEGLRGWRVLFDSTLGDDRPTVVSGLVYVPIRSAPADGWPVLSFAHPTTGLADRCAPSKAPGILETTVASLAGQIGMAMVASDYPGLGTAGLHPFLDGVSSGRSVLDIIGAAGDIDGVKLSPTVVVWGHSQGGHAALFAGRQAPNYAPEQRVVGVVAGAPPSQLRDLVGRLQSTPERGYTLLVANGLAAANTSLNTTDVLTTRGLEVSKRLETQCSGEIISATSKDTLRLPGPIPADWARALDADEPGAEKVEAPVFIVHGGLDQLVPVASSDVLAKQLRALGTSVERKVYPAEGHADVALTSLTDVLNWISARGIAGGPATAAATTPTRPTAKTKYAGATGRLRALLTKGESKPLVVAHAGGDLEAPHSTPFAFKRAQKLGVDVLEMDVRLSSDGVLVVHHDPTVDRTTNATGPVAELSAAALGALDNAHWFTGGCWDCRTSGKVPPYRGVRTGSVKPPADYVAEDFRIATFDEIANMFPDMVLDIEIKTDGPDAGLEVARALAARLKGDPSRDRFLVVSFDDVALNEFRKLAPAIATSPGFSAISNYVLAGTPLTNVAVLQVPPQAQGLPVFTEELRTKAAADGIAIWVWPSDPETDDAANYRSLLAAKPNGIIAGRPEVLRGLL